MSKKGRRSRVANITVAAPLDEVVGTIIDELYEQLPSMEKSMGMPLRVIKSSPKEGGVRVEAVYDPPPPPLPSSIETVKDSDGMGETVTIIGTSVRLHIRQLDPAEPVGLSITIEPVEEKADLLVLGWMLRRMINSFPSSRAFLREALEHSEKGLERFDPPQ